MSPASAPFPLTAAAAAAAIAAVEPISNSPVALSVSAPPVPSASTVSGNLPRVRSYSSGCSVDQPVSVYSLSSRLSDLLQSSAAFLLGRLALLRHCREISLGSLAACCFRDSILGTISFVASVAVISTRGPWNGRQRERGELEHLVLVFFFLSRRWTRSAYNGTYLVGILIGMRRRCFRDAEIRHGDFSSAQQALFNHLHGRRSGHDDEGET